MYFGDYLLVNLGQIRGRKCSENPKFLRPSAFGEKREPLLIGHSGASSPPIGRSAYIHPPTSIPTAAWNFWFWRVQNMYFGKYLQVNLGQIRGGKCSENPKYLCRSAFGENQKQFLNGPASSHRSRCSYLPGDLSSRVSVKFFGFEGCITCILEAICRLSWVRSEVENVQKIPIFMDISFWGKSGATSDRSYSVIQGPAPLPYVVVLIFTLKLLFTHQREIFWFWWMLNMNFGAYLQVHFLRFF